MESIVPLPVASSDPLEPICNATASVPVVTLANGTVAGTPPAAGPETTYHKFVEPSYWKLTEVAELAVVGIVGVAPLLNPVLNVTAWPVPS